MTVIFCTLIGTELYHRQRSVRDMLGDACTLCLHMMSMVRYERAEPEMIIRSYNSEHSQLTALCCRFLDNGCSFHEAWHRTTEHISHLKLNTDELAIISELGAGFGKTDTDGELARLARISDDLTKLHSQRREECCRTGKMYVTSGFLAGVMITLFMI